MLRRRIIMSEEKKRLAERVARVKRLQEEMKRPIPPPEEEKEKEAEE